MYKLVEDMRERCKGSALCTVGYGHLGDGNLHLNVVGSSHSSELLSLIEPYVYERTGTYTG
jgi:D-2-hydroxyglutarate dehydrogenase